MTGKLGLYSAVGNVLTHYDLDVVNYELKARESMRVPAIVQYAWPHPTRKYFYIATSNRSPGLGADFNHVSAYLVDAGTGQLMPHGGPRPLRSRAVHICVHPSGRYLISAHNLPRSDITIHALTDDGKIGPEKEQTNKLDFGNYPHQVMSTERTVILVARGNDAVDRKQEDPGSLRMFDFSDGLLSQAGIIAPNGGHGFGPRHLDFHPNHKWVYVSLERQNKLHMYRMRGDTLEGPAAYVADTLAEPHDEKPRQLAGTIHVHPSGRYVYVVNRADWTKDYQGEQVFAGGENTIAVYVINQETGEPTLIQHAEINSFHVRTFAIDPGGRMLVAASIKPLKVREGNRTREVPAALAVFSVGSTGKLEFVRKYDVETKGQIQYWMGMLELPTQLLRPDPNRAR